MEKCEIKNTTSLTLLIPKPLEHLLKGRLLSISNKLERSWVNLFCLFERVWLIRNFKEYPSSEMSSGLK